MNIDTSRERTARLRNISLQSILLATGAQQDPHDKKKWHTIQGAISIDDIKFMNWNRAQGGGGAIDLIIHLYGLNFKSATSWLHSHFPEHTASNPIAPNLKPPLKLPSPAPEKLNTVKQYLNTARRIPAHLIDRLIQRGDLYADHSANAVFLMRGKHHIPIGAELRGTGPHPWRGMATGSNKNTGGFFIRKTHIEGIVLCESAIDAISCFLYHPATCCISTAGARPSPTWLRPLIQKDQPIYCGYDADATGDAIANTMISRHPSIIRRRPDQHDWNEMLTSRP